MTTRKHTIAVIAIALLLTAQLAVAVHSVEHPFHVADIMCAAYHSAEHLESSVTVTGSPVLPVFFQVGQVGHAAIAIVALAEYFNHPRAPPVIS